MKQIGANLPIAKKYFNASVMAKSSLSATSIGPSQLKSRLNQESTFKNTKGPFEATVNDEVKLH